MIMSLAIETQGCLLVRVLKSTGTYTGVQGTPDTITRSTGSFVDDGFLVGDTIRTSQADPNDGPFTLSAVAALTLTLVETSLTGWTAATTTISGDCPIGEMTSYTGPGGSASVINVSHLQSTRQEKRMGLPDEGQFTFDINFIPGDRGQIRVRQDRIARTEQTFRLYLTDVAESYLEFNAFVLGFEIAGAVDDKVSGSVTLEITGAVNQYTGAGVLTV
jgi:hypothetical protein